MRPCKNKEQKEERWSWNKNLIDRVRSSWTDMTLLLCPYNSDVKAGRLQITSEGKYYTGIKLYENDFNFASDLLKFLRLLGKKKRK